MYWIYNVLLIFYWIGLIPVILYRLAFEDGFYERIKQSAGYMPATLLKKIEGRRAIWIHAASVGEIVATSPLVKEIKREFPEAVVVVICCYGYRSCNGTSNYSGSRRYYLLSF